MRTNIITEREMIDTFLCKVAGNFAFVIEVPVFAKSVDLVKIDKNTNLISAIEFKTTKWRKAMAQALGAAIVFDFLEICIIRPVTEKCRLLIMDECQQNGVGLYFLDSVTKEIEHIVAPLTRSEVWGIQHEQILQYLMRRIEK